MHGRCNMRLFFELADYSQLLDAFMGQIAYFLSFCSIYSLLVQ